MKGFFTNWMSIFLIFSVLWFGGRGMGLIRLEQTLEESVRAAAIGDVLPQEITTLRISGLTEQPPRVEVIELDAPTAMVGRLRVRDLKLRIEGMTFETQGEGPLARHVPVAANSGVLSMRATWDDIDASIAAIVRTLVPGPLRPEVVVDHIGENIELVLLRGNNEERIPATFTIEESGKIRLVIFPTRWGLKILPRKFKNQVLGRMPGTRGLPWEWEQVVDEEGILLRGRVRGT